MYNPVDENLSFAFKAVCLLQGDTHLIENASKTISNSIGKQLLLYNVFALFCCLGWRWLCICAYDIIFLLCV